MSHYHRVSKGEDLAVIARRYGVPADTIWNDAANQSLKRIRSNPNVLQQGDKLFIPDINTKTLDASAGQRHLFRIAGVVAQFRLRIFRNDRPVANEPYAMAVDGRHLSGSSSGDGWIEQYIDVMARGAVLNVGDQLYLQLKLGHLDPVEHLLGVQQRLWNLGFYRGPLNAQFDTRTTIAVKAFQKYKNLDVNGQLDDRTRSMLCETHGS